MNRKRTNKQSAYKTVEGLADTFFLPATVLVCFSKRVIRWQSRVVVPCEQYWLILGSYETRSSVFGMSPLNTVVSVSVGARNMKVPHEARSAAA